MTEQSKHGSQDRELARSIKESKAPAISRAAAILRLLGKSDEVVVLVQAASRFKINPSDGFLKEFDGLDCDKSLRFLGETAPAEAGPFV